MKYMMVISYDGSKFHGFQRQNNLRNVQGYLEQNLSNILKEDVIIKGSGRTDAFVHARYQVVHFITNKDITKLKYQLNKVLKDVKVKKIKKVDNNFHARHSVKYKVYLYKIDLLGNKDSNYYTVVKKKLDINKMRKASKEFIGTHDFTNFSSGEKDNFTTTIQSIKIYKFNNVLYLKFKGYAFYRYMVRNLVGALIEVGKNKIDSNRIKEMLNNNNSKRLPTSKPNGLYLWYIKY